MSISPQDQIFCVFRRCLATPAKNARNSRTLTCSSVDRHGVAKSPHQRGVAQTIGADNPQGHADGRAVGFHALGSESISVSTNKCAIKNAKTQTCGVRPGTDNRASSYSLGAAKRRCIVKMATVWCRLKPKMSSRPSDDNARHPSASRCPTCTPLIKTCTGLPPNGAALPLRRGSSPGGRGADAVREG